jgi:Kef-type K+ transport system membrane component KefB
MVVAAALAVLMRLLKQPIFLGYVLTGLLLGPQFLNLMRSSDTLTVFSQMGTVVLLFIVGLHLSPKEIKDLGKNVFITGSIQVLVVALLGYVISKLFGFTTTESILLGAAASFSSTIIALKLITDKKDLEKLYSRLSMGILLLQDFIAVVVLVLVAAFSSGGINPTSFLLLIGKGIFLFVAALLFSYYVLPSITNYFAQSQEYLFLFSLAWGLGLSSLFWFFGFSAEIGALAAGVSLSVSPFAQEISSKFKPLRDFFVVTFFIFLGSKITFGSTVNLLVPLLCLFSLVLVIKPLIITITLRIIGYNERTSFLTGVSLGQLSEFSLVLMLMASKTGMVSNEVFSLVTVLGFFSIAVSSYLITYAERYIPVVLPVLKKIGKNGRKLDKKTIDKSYDAILFGCNRAGYDFVKMFSAFKDKFLAVDFNPQIIKELSEKGINCVYGDAEDGEFLEEVKVDRSRIVVSTIPDYETNLFLVSRIRNQNQKTLVVVVSYNVDEAIKLYEAGATYVVLPHFIGGEFAARLTSEAGFDIEKLRGKREQHIKYLNERKDLGHAHPYWSHN